VRFRLADFRSPVSLVAIPPESQHVAADRRCFVVIELQQEDL
jgi:hypothetical protein